jgi:hypothetical protein
MRASAYAGSLIRRSFSGRGIRYLDDQLDLRGPRMGLAIAVGAKVQDGYVGLGLPQLVQDHRVLHAHDGRVPEKAGEEPVQLRPCGGIRPR